MFLKMDLSGLYCELSWEIFKVNKTGYKKGLTLYSTNCVLKCTNFKYSPK